MLPTTIEALLIFALVLSPGYVFTQIARRVIPHIQEPSDVRFLLTIITTGTVLHGLAFPWTSRILDYYVARALHENRWEIFAWASVTGFLAPLLLGIVAGRLTLRPWVEKALDFIGLGYVDRMPSAWDFVMRRREPDYVRIHLKDGKGVVGGVFAGQSLGSLDPKRPDIYLEQAWQLDEDGIFRQAIPDSRGLWVAHDVMAHVYFLEGADRPHDESEQRPHPEVAAEPHGDGAGHREAGRTAGWNGEALPPAARSADREED